MHGPGARTSKAQEQGASARHQAVGFMLKTYVKGRLCPGGFKFMGVEGG